MANPVHEQKVDARCVCLKISRKKKNTKTLFTDAKDSAHLILLVQKKFRISHDKGKTNKNQDIFWHEI